ncbi:MAG TPA: SDR family oxidoreductase [Myxococcota bacterium]|jgi:NAD(P)-dependent dehydrogenase (short-subunit alcohol dehydrogenase family)
MSVRLDLEGKRVLVLGASSGIGRAVAELAAESGARLALAARRRDRLDALAGSLRAGGREAHVVSCDVARDADCRAAVEHAAQELGGLDALVYAPGISPLVLLEEARREDWREVLDANLIGASQVTAAALPHLRASQGRAVYVGSYSARQTLPGISLYSVSKLALSGLVASWRMEHPDVDFVHVVLGNTFGTEFAASWGAERTAMITKQWIARGLFPAPKMMPLRAAAEAIATTLAVGAFLDDVGVMPRMRDGAV